MTRPRALLATEVSKYLHRRVAVAGLLASSRDEGGGEVAKFLSRKKRKPVTICNAVERTAG